MNFESGNIKKPVFLSFLGFSNTGKTTMISTLIQLFGESGIEVTAVKRAHKELEIDGEGHDSDRFNKAGAGNVMLLGTGSSVVFSRRYHSSALPEREDLIRLFPGTDIFLIEGFAFDGAVRILCVGAVDTIGGLKYPLEDIDILVTDKPELIREAESVGKKNISPERPEELKKLFLL